MLQLCKIGYGSAKSVVQKSHHQSKIADKRMSASLETVQMPQIEYACFKRRWNFPIY
jgi:hypothetical protein